MECPKCSFDHPDQTAECLRCGIVFAKHAARQQEAAELPLPVAEEGAARLSVEDARLELYLRLLAVPLALVAARLLVASPLQSLLRVFLSMWVHESGHAVTAWFCGYGGFPGPWFTPVTAERVPLVPVALAGVLAWGGYSGWRRGRRAAAAAFAALLVLQGVCTLLPARSANALIIFGGDGGCLLLGTLLMTTFYARRDSALFRGGLRWGFLVIGAAAFMDAFATWSGALHDFSLIPFGENEGVGLSDPSKLTEDYGWDVSSMVHRYLFLAGLCFALLALLYGAGIVQMRRLLRAPTAAPRQ